MKFTLVYWNHWNFGIQIADTLRLIKLGLESAGHEVNIEREICTKSINIVIECFVQQHVYEMEEAASQGAKFIIIASEDIANGSFNYFKEEGDDNSHYTQQIYWRMRYDNFIRVEPLSIAVWHLGKVIDRYRKTLGHNRVFYFPHRYVDNYKTVRHRPDNKKDIDFLFTGTLTKYRETILDELSNKGFSVKYTKVLKAPFHREELLSRAKVCLNLKQYAKWPYPSVSRYFYHAINDSLLVSEVCDYDSDLQPYVTTAGPEDDFVEFCIQQHEIGSYNERAYSTFQRLQEEMAGEREYGELIELSLQGL